MAGRQPRRQSRRAGTSAMGSTMEDANKAHVHVLVRDLASPEKKEAALLQLSKMRKDVNDLAPILWHGPGTVTAMLQEIISIYPLLTPPALSAHRSIRVCNALELLQCIASHDGTRMQFLAAQIQIYLYPFLDTVSKTPTFEDLRLASLGVIGALVETDSPAVIDVLLQTEIIPLCLRIMEMGSELNKTAAIFVMQKILLDRKGLAYICATPQRFHAVSNVLGNMVAALNAHPSACLLKQVLRCYQFLAENERACTALQGCLPETVEDETKYRDLLEKSPDWRPRL